MATEIRPLLPIIFLSFLISSALFNVSSASPDEELGPVDGFHELDPSGPEIVAIANFAVDENNKRQKENIKFQSVVKVAGQQVGEKTEYGLIIKGEDNGVSNTYAAVVLDSKVSGREFVGFIKQAFE